MDLNRIRNRYFLIADIILLPAAVYVSYVLRLEEFGPASRWWPGMVALAVFSVLVTPLVFRKAGIYARFWRYASVDELLLLTGVWTVAVILTSALAIGLGFLATNRLWIPRSIPFLLLLLGLVATAGPRLFVRVSSRRALRRGEYWQAAMPVLIMGAGDAGVMIAREIEANPQLGMRTVGFLDDDAGKRGMVIQGKRVIGDRHDIRVLAPEHQVKRVIIAMPTASGKEIRDVVRLCEMAQVETKIVPGIYEMLDSKITFNQVRNVQIEDLLRREVVHTDLNAVHDLIAGKRVLITGAGGSIGSELARQVYHAAPAEIVLLDHTENSIFDIYHELLERPGTTGVYERKVHAGQSVALRPVVADIRMADRIECVIAEVQPEIIFHAAAHKHVPLMEENPAEAVLNNVIGTRTLLQAAVRNGVPHFVMISTDKAVNPTSVMGATKRVAELQVLATAARTGRAYVTVRFGNVLGSRGSVVPTFRRQIAAGGPITITDPEVRRYFMTIPEAVQLVLQASVLGQGGDLFMLNMGEPIRIVDLAEDLVRLSGLELGKDIDIVYTGLRPGEKLFEELFGAEEQYDRTEHERIYRVQNGGVIPERLEMKVNALYAAALANDTEGVIDHLCLLAPEYRAAHPVHADGEGETDALDAAMVGGEHA